MASRKDSTGSGNPARHNISLDKQLIGYGTALVRGSNAIGTNAERGIFIKAFRLVLKDPDLDEWLVVITASTENGQIVAFHGGTSMIEAFTSALNRLVNGSLKWKEDEYAR